MDEADTVLRLLIIMLTGTVLLYSPLSESISFLQLCLDGSSFGTWHRAFLVTGTYLPLE